jgi:hypothetical protein
MKWLFRTVSSRAIAKGSSRWMAFAVVIGALRFLRRVTGAEPHRLYREELQPGDVLVIREPKARS